MCLVVCFIKQGKKNDHQLISTLYNKYTSFPFEHMSDHHSQETLDRLRYFCILSGAQSNDLIQHSTGIVYSSEEAIRSSIKRSNTKPPLSRSFIKYLLATYFLLNGVSSLKLQLSKKEQDNFLNKLFNKFSSIEEVVERKEIESMIPFILTTASIFNFVMFFYILKTRKLSLEKKFAIRSIEQKENQKSSLFLAFRNFLNRYIWWEPSLNDDPVYNKIQSFKKSLSYANTNNCLKHLIDQRFHLIFKRIHTNAAYTSIPLNNSLFQEHIEKYNTPILCALRKQLLHVSSPMIYTNSRKLSPRFFFRLNGSPRESIAEIALAIAYHWKISDKVLSTAFSFTKSLNAATTRWFNKTLKTNKNTTLYTRKRGLKL